MIAKPEMCYCNLAHSALACFRMGMSGFPNCEPTQRRSMPALLISLPEPAQSGLHR